MTLPRSTFLPAPRKPKIVTRRVAKLKNEALPDRHLLSCKCQYPASPRPTTTRALRSHPRATSPAWRPRLRGQRTWSCICGKWPSRFRACGTPTPCRDAPRDAWLQQLRRPSAANRRDIFKFGIELATLVLQWHARRARALGKLGVLKRQRAYPLAGRRKNRVEDGRSGHANGGFPNPAPEITGRHHDRLDLRKVFHEHHRIAVQIFLHHTPILDGAFLVEHRAQTEGNGALGLHRDLLRIDDITAVDRNHQAMNFELPAVADGDLRGSGTIATVTHELSNASMQAGRRRCCPSDFLCHGIEHGEVLRIIDQKLAPELERVLTRGVGDLVDERFHPDRILVSVDAAPEAHGYMRVANGVLNQEIGNGITKAPFRATRIEALKGRRIPAILVEPIWRCARQNRWCCDAHVQSDQVALFVEASL